MDSYFASTSPVLKSHELAQQLQTAVDDLAHKLQGEKNRLLTLGMTLPRNTLENLEELHKDFNKVTQRIEENQLELRQLRNLARTTELINSSLDLNDVLNDVMNRVIQLAGAERGYIMLRDDATGELSIAVARKLDAVASEEEITFSRTIVERVMNTRESVTSTNAQEDERFSEEQSVIGFALRSIICVPLTTRDKVIGAVYCDNRMRDGMFARRELRMLTVFSHQAAIAIENARLFEQVKQTLQEISEIKSLLDNILASIASGVLTTDANETVTIYNPAAEQILGRPAIQTMGHTLDAAIPALYYQIRSGLRQIGLNNSVQLETEVELQNRGVRNLNLQLAPLRNDQNRPQGIALVVDDLTEIKKRDLQIAAIRRYLPPVMVDNIQTIDRLALGGERRNITIMFADVRSFDTFDDKVSPHALMDTLNTYLTIASEGIHNHAGLIDKYMGSEIMSLFNTQLNPVEDHTWQAIQAALRIAADFTTFATHMQHGGDQRTYYRIGIHSGIATLGNVGSSERREFTAIGDSVNLAKRLQENARIGQILVSEDAIQTCNSQLKQNPWIGVKEVDTLLVKGRTRPTNVYEIFDNRK